MKLFAALALLPSLFVLGCGPTNRKGGASESSTSPTGGGMAADLRVPVVRVAELEIDPAQLERYRAAVKEEIETSVRDEPGVLAIYAVAERDNASKLRFFEMYADEAAYHAHLESAHFKKYATAVKTMIVSKRLIDAVPIQLSAKPK